MRPEAYPDAVAPDELPKPMPTPTNGPRRSVMHLLRFSRYHPDNCQDARTVRGLVGCWALLGEGAVSGISERFARVTRRECRVACRATGRHTVTMGFDVDLVRGLRVARPLASTVNLARRVRSVDTQRDKLRCVTGSTPHDTQLKGSAHRA